MEGVGGSRRGARERLRGALLKFVDGSVIGEPVVVEILPDMQAAEIDPDGNVLGLCAFKDLHVQLGDQISAPFETEIVKRESGKMDKVFRKRMVQIRRGARVFVVDLTVSS
jgi:hypothetical protein